MSPPAHGLMILKDFRVPVISPWRTSRVRVIACANSIWVFMNLENGRPGRLMPRMQVSMELQKPTRKTLERKITLPKEEGETFESFPVMEYHLDMNHHVNNGQYIQIAQDIFLRTWRLEASCGV